MPVSQTVHLRGWATALDEEQPRTQRAVIAHLQCGLTRSAPFSGTKRSPSMARYSMFATWGNSLNWGSQEAMLSPEKRRTDITEVIRTEGRVHFLKFCGNVFGVPLLETFHSHKVSVTAKTATEVCINKALKFPKNKDYTSMYANFILQIMVQSRRQLNTCTAEQLITQTK